MFQTKSDQRRKNVMYTRWATTTSINGVITQRMGVLTPFISRKGPPCTLNIESAIIDLVRIL